MIPYFYIKSVQPVALERKIGAAAWKKCARYRLVSAIFMTITVVNYIAYYFFPLPLPLQRRFPWPWLTSIAVAVFILAPALYLLVRGGRDAGKETMQPSPEHQMYGGIYEKMRHPQAVGESVTWLGGAFLLNSPLLALYSLVWPPIYYLMCRAEEKDLVQRYGQPYVDYMARTGLLFSKATAQSTDRTSVE